jgi:hypothetical protein
MHTERGRLVLQQYGNTVNDKWQSADASVKQDRHLKAFRAVRVVKDRSLTTLNTSQFTDVGNGTADGKWQAATENGRHRGKAGISITLASGHKPASGQGRHQHSAGIGINAGHETALAL